MTLPVIGDIHTSQGARLLDLALITPAIIWIAVKPETTKVDKRVLLAIGLFALYYNASNYLRNR